MRKRDKEEASETGGYVVKRNRRQSMEKMACLFCQQEGGNLHEFRTLEANKSVRQMAIHLQDTELMARIEGGDLVALEAKYHLECLTGLHNCHRSFKLQQVKECGESFEESQVKARALVELFSYIENCVDEGLFYFKFSVLHQLYEQRIQTLGFQRKINWGRLREKILEYFSQSQDQSDGKNKVLVFEQGMQQMLKQIAKTDYEGETLLLAKAAKILHRELANFNGFQFNGNLTSGCQQGSIPSVLKMFISMLQMVLILKTMISLTHKQFSLCFRPFCSTIKQNLRILPPRFDMLQTKSHHCHCSLA